MWRGIVLGKLTVSILASIVVCYVCFQQAAGAEDWSESLQWSGLGIFFAFLGVVFVASIFLLHYRKRPK